MRRDDSPVRPERDVTQPRAKPNQAWVCGYTDLGQGCRTGPTCDGRCARTLEERVAVSTGNDNAGQASSEPALEALPPCIPRRSLGVRRLSLRMNLAVLTSGLLMLCMTLPSREKIFVPGELSAKHAQILDNTVAAQRCGLCHPSSHAGSDPLATAGALSGLLSSAKRLIENDGRQDRLCLQCHQGHMPAAANRDPHDLTPEMWRRLQPAGDTPWQLVSARRASGLASAASSGDLINNPSSDPSSDQRVVGVADEEQMKLAKTSCAMCHSEHHGRGFDVKLISDSRCQACHKKQFESLASGHPEFANYPVDRPRGLAFSHGAHAQNHFPKKNRDFDCKACHLATGPGKSPAGTTDPVMRSLSFEHACASCHDQSIRAATVDGWATLQLPSIEPVDAANDAALADWPAAARYGYDGEVSPVMRALLMADPMAAEVLTKLPVNGKISELSSATGLRSNVAKTLAAATAGLLEETARDGQAAWIRRLQLVTRTHLDRELNDADHGLITAMVAGLPPDLFRHVHREWFRRATPLAQQEKVNGQLASAQLPPVAPPTSSDDLLGDQKSVDADDLLLGTTAPTDAEAETKIETAAPPPLVKGATHLTGGGWYADQSTLAIRYMPTGHADSTLAAWTIWWSLLESQKSVLPGGDAELIARRFNTASPNTVSPNRTLPNTASALVHRQAELVPGNCAQCHQLNGILGKFASRKSTGRIADLYQVPKRADNIREFTKFQHTPHLTLPALNDCRYCHQEKSQLSVALNDSALRQHPLTSEFTTMKRSQCTACHSSGGASDRCVQCHNYHVDLKF